MIKWIQYRRAATRAVYLRRAKEVQNKAEIAKEEKEYRDLYEAELQKGTRVDDDAGVFGARGRRDHNINILKGEITKAERDVAEIHTVYLLNEVDRLGIPHPDIKKAELWLSDREEYPRRDGDRDIDDRELLSVSGLHDVRSAIRKERKERLEPLKDRAAIIFGVGGIIIAVGSLIVAVLTLSLRTLEVAASHPIPAPASSPPPAMPAPASSPPSAMPAPASSPPPAMPAPASSPPSTAAPPLPVKP
jgi:hypothetical protein